MKEWSREEDLGGIEDVALTDVLSEIMAGLAGGYAILCFYEEKKNNPDRSSIGRWKKRREELGAIKSFFAKGDKSYEDMRRWIKVYSEELKSVDALRKTYANAA